MRSIVLFISLLSLPGVAFAEGEGGHGGGEHATEPAHGAEAGHGEEAHADAGHGGSIPWNAIGLHTVNFVLLVGGLGLLLRPIIKDALNQRSASIREELEESNRLRREALNRFEDLESKLTRFQEELERMKADGAAAAEHEAAYIAERTERDIELLKESTARTIRSETEQARRALRREAVDLAVKIAEEQLRAQVGEADQVRLNTQLLSSIGQEAANG
ncbi:MAG: hypothetical protein H6741_26870 [Alphaproteobacteria bacterium]|nr:hypothetical protein [Alphaproteobacteria bacterium]MCB9796334.1 hypothetical protein [Alphaproteobacteria bacterium]